MVADENRTTRAPRLCRLSLAIAFLVLLGVVGYAYAPSLFHTPRCDQWAYLMETIGQEKFRGVVAHTWSYSRTRMIGPGDTQLFRPLLFVLLAAEKALFGNHFELWQATGVALHLVICVLLFSVLRRLRTLCAGPETSRSLLDLLPYVLTLFFAVNFAIVEQVIWTHIAGYLLFALLTLAAVRLLLEVCDDHEPTSARPAGFLAAAWVLLLLASFAYELGQICALCVGLFLAAASIRLKRFRKAALLLVLFSGIAVIYQSANHLDRWYHRATYEDDVTLSDVLELIPTEACADNVGRYISFVVVQPFLPWDCPTFLHQTGKLCVEERFWQGKVVWDAWGVIGITVFGITILLILLGLAHLIRGGPHPLVMLLCIGFVAGHTALIVFGRLNLRPHCDTLTLNPYYVYISLLFLLIAGAVPLLRLDRARKTWFVARPIVPAMFVGLLLLSMASIVVTRQVNEETQRISKPVWVGNNLISSFIESHRSVPHFRLALLRNPSDRPALGPCVLILYHRYLDSARPTHFISGQGGGLAIISVEEWQKEHPDENPSVYPDLICFQPGLAVFRVDGLYCLVSLNQFNEFVAAPDSVNCPRTPHFPWNFR